MSGNAPGAGQQGGQDPSMEDILASIRRILNEDEAATPPAPAAAPTPAAPAAAAPPPPPEPPAAPEPLELTEEMLISPPATTAAEPPPPERYPATTPDPGQALVAPAVAAAAAAAVSQLYRTVSAERSATVTRGGPSIEDVVREELRPLLKEWLDRHLPPLVERLVRAEIERVVGRAVG